MSRRVGVKSYESERARGLGFCTYPCDQELNRTETILAWLNACSRNEYAGQTDYHI